MDSNYRVWSRDPAHRRTASHHVAVNPERLEGWARRRLAICDGEWGTAQPGRRSQ